jgi:hypothetical protein
MRIQSNTISYSNASTGYISKKSTSRRIATPRNNLPSSTSLSQKAKSYQDWHNYTPNPHKIHPIKINQAAIAKIKVVIYCYLKCRFQSLRPVIAILMAARTGRHRGVSTKLKNRARYAKHESQGGRKGLGQVRRIIGAKF